MKVLVRDLRAEGDMSDVIWSRFREVQQRTKALELKDDLIPRKRLHRRCFEEVNSEILAKSLWWPVEENMAKPTIRIVEISAARH